MAEATSFYLKGEYIEFLIAALNSSLSEWFFSKIGTTTGVGTVRWKKYTIEQLLVAKPSAKVLKNYLCVFNKYKNNQISAQEFEVYVNNFMYELYGLNEEEIAFIEGK